MYSMSQMERKAFGQHKEFVTILVQDPANIPHDKLAAARKTGLPIFIIGIQQHDTREFVRLLAQNLTKLDGVVMRYNDNTQRFTEIK